MATKSMVRGLIQARPFILVILLQFAAAGLNIIIKFALNEGMNQHVLVVYRNIFATLAIAPFALVLERKTRPKMTYSIFTKIFLLALLEPVIDQNLFFTGMKFTTATFGAAMGNIIPAFVFIMAWIIGLEKVNVRRIHSQAKMFGTVVTLGGAMFMTMFKGPALGLPWTSESNNHAPSNPESSQISGKGAAMIGSGCVCWASFIILQTITLKTYPCELSLTALICVLGASQGSVVALALEWGNPAAWAVHVDATLFAYLYTGIVSSGIGYYVQGLVIREKGPVFVTAFNPLCMIIVAVLSSFILSEMMYLGRIIGGAVIIIGLYMVLWGKGKDDESPSESSKKVLAPEDETTNKTELMPFDGHKGRVGEESV